MLLSFDTKNQIITRTDANRAIANSTDYFEVSVTFSANWNGYDKTICFKNGDTEINIMLVNNAVPKEAHLNLGVGTWKVSIIGIKGNHKILTNAVNLPVGASGYIGTTGPTPRVYEELLTIIQSLHTEVASEAALRSAVEQFVDENFHDIVISDVYSKSEIDSMIVTKTVNDLVYYWNKSQTYNRAEIEALIEAAIQGTYIVVQTLPTTDISTHAIYLVPKESATVGDYYDEYINTTGTSAGWEHIGTTEIDLSNYYTKAEINALLDNKVDKVSGKGLSTNDYDNTAKSIVDGVTSALANKVDKETGKGLSTNDYDNTAKGIVDGVTAALAGKVDKETGKGLSTNDYDNTEKAKLAGISDGATKTESSLTNGHLKIDGVEKTVYDDTALDSRVDVVEQDLSTDTATVEGNPLNFSTLTAQKANETVISLEPIQDLHGYDHPWPAGGGKNKLPMTVDGIKELNPTTTTRVWDGNICKIGANQEMIVTILTDSDNNVIGIKFNGIYTSNVIFKLANFTFLANVSYSMNGCPSGGGNRYLIGTNTTAYQSEGPFIDAGSGVTFSYSQDSQLTPNITVYANNQVNNVVFQPMIRLSTETDPTFAPYSNYCPIDGRTETSLVGCGKNQLPIVYTTQTKSQVTMTVNSDGTLSFSGTASSLEYFITTFTLRKGSYLFTSGVNETFSTFDTYLTVSGTTIARGGNGGDNAFTLTEDRIVVISIRVRQGINMSGVIIYPMIRFSTITDATYEPFVQSNDLTIQFGEKVYGAKVELEKGTVTVTWGYIASYNGETLPGEWISDRDVYAPNTSPSTGAEVAYELATPRTIQLTPNEISLLMGVNNISTDADGIKLTYRDGKVATLGDLDELVKKIADCEDVEITDLQAGDSLVWDATAGKWKNQQSTNTHVYSTTEQVVGTWVDGSTIYEKTITGLSFTTVLDGWADSGASLSDVDKVIKCECGQNFSSMIEICFAKVDNGKLYIWTTNRVTYEFNNIVIQYTKTTPTLLMQSTPTEESTPADESESTDENR